MRNLAHYASEHNQTWLELSLIAQDLLAWMKLICLTGELAVPEPKSAAARRRSTRPPRPPHPTPHTGQLALGADARQRVHQAALNPALC